MAAVAINRPEDAMWKQRKCEACIKVCNAKRKNTEWVESFIYMLHRQGTFAAESPPKPESPSGSQRLNSLVGTLS